MTFLDHAPSLRYATLCLFSITSFTSGCPHKLSRCPLPNHISGSEREIVGKGFDFISPPGIPLTKSLAGQQHRHEPAKDLNLGRRHQRLVRPAGSDVQLRSNHFRRPCPRPVQRKSSPSQALHQCKLNRLFFRSEVNINGSYWHSCPASYCHCLAGSCTNDSPKRASTTSIYPSSRCISAGFRKC